jgi:ferredoxin
MKIISIDKQQWGAGLEKARSQYRLYGPVDEGQFHNFKLLGDGELPDFKFLNSRLSPKAAVYPQSEILFEYSLDENDPDHHLLKEAPKDYSPKALIGIRPCDADAFELVRKNFDAPEYKDPYWIKSYEATLMVGFACQSPCSSCFCTTAGSGPFHEDNLDILLIDKGEVFWGQVLSEKGAQFVQAAGWTSVVADEQDALAQIEAMKETAENKIRCTVDTDQLSHKVINELFEAPFWEDVAFACINCGTCTYVCPTCWCFDIQDENRGQSGCRMRNWDSCMFPLFTLHGSGHNPRNTKMRRVRQRFMHKLKYYVDKYDHGIQCVGCGRCIRQCPVNIDIRRICNLMNNYGSEKACTV